MAFCSNCGAQLKEGAKFCVECGNHVIHNNTNDNFYNQNKKYRRESFFEGEIHKCPSCGANLKSFEHICTECGHEIRGANNYGAVKEFSIKLEDEFSIEKRKEIISKFYVPNTKEDIYEFFIYAISNINTDTSCEEAWEAKLEQTYQKARISFGNTEEFQYISKLYNEALKNNKKKDFRKFLNKRSKIICYSFLVTIGIVMLILGFTLPTYDDDPLYALGIIGFFPLLSPIFIQSFLDDKEHNNKK